MSVPFYNLLYNLEVDPGAEEPLYLQVAGRIAEVIRGGRLQPGAPMPGTRTLAKALGIGRNAAIAAYGELHDQGWIITEVGFGTRVALTLPDFGGSPGRTPAWRDPHRSGSGRISTCGFELASPWSAAVVAPLRARVDLQDPEPDPRLFPEDDLARALRRAVALCFGRARRPPDPAGPREVRATLAEFLAERRALPADPDAILLTAGRQDALSLVVRHLFPPGSAVAVEDPGNPRAWAALHLAGAQPVPVPVDAEGIRPEALEDVCIAQRPRALYLTPNLQWPTGAVLSPERRSAVLELAGRYRMAVLEDDHAAELYYEERDWRPLAAEDRRAVVLHIGSFERLVGPAFALGFIAGPKEAIAALVRARAEEGGGDLDLVAWALRDLLLDGLLLRQVRKARTAYRARRDQALEGLAGLSGLCVQAPASGLALWLEGEDLEPWRRGAEAVGIALRPASHWALSPDAAQGLLFPFARLEEAELKDILELLRRVRNTQSRSKR